MKKKALFLLFLIFYQPIFTTTSNKNIETKNKKKRVCGLGQAMVDFCVILPEKDLVKQMQQLKIEKKGGWCPLNIQQKNQIFEDLNIKYKKTICSGGSTANVMAWIAHLGETAAFVGNVANDFLGNFFIKDLQQFKVDVFCDRIGSENDGTGVVISLISQDDGERTMAGFPGVSLNCFKNHSFLKSNYFNDFEIFFSEGYMFIEPKTKEFVLSCFNKLKQLKKNDRFFIICQISCRNSSKGVRFFIEKC
jgi:sugar/nucleoside kinase (ribokinase family)